MRIKGIQVQRIDPINSPWPFLTWHTTNGSYLPTTNHLCSCLHWRWLLSSHQNHHWLAPRQHPLMGWEGSYPDVGFWSLPVNLWGNSPLCFLLMKILIENCRLPGIPSMGLWKKGSQKMRLSFTIGGGETCTWTCSSMTVCGWIWSEEWNGFVVLIRLVLTIWFS